MKVELTESAFKDLGNALKYYEEQGVPETGRRLVASILKKAERSVKHPEPGRIVPEFGVPFLREVIAPHSGSFTGGTPIKFGSSAFGEMRGC